MTSDIHHDHDGKPLNRSETVKRQLERDAARLFMRGYEQSHGTPMRNIWHNDPAKPDISCHLDGKPLDLEIAHLYASVSEAKRLTDAIIQQVDQPLANSNTSTNTRANPDQQERELAQYLSELLSIDPQQRLLTALGHILQRKAEKHYQSTRVWLVIRNASPLWQQQDFLRVKQQLRLSNHPFEHIWLLPDFDGSQALQLF